MLSQKVYDHLRPSATVCPKFYGLPKIHEPDAKEFITKIEQTKLDEDEILVISDVVSLFTNVPIDEACNIAKELLLLDNTLHLRTIPFLLKI